MEKEWGKQDSQIPGLSSTHKTKAIQTFQHALTTTDLEGWSPRGTAYVLEKPSVFHLVKYYASAF